MELNTKTKISLIILLIVVVFSIAGYFIFANGIIRPNNQSSMPEDYVIEGVPYVGLHSLNREKTSFISTDLGAAVFSLLDYWNPGNNDLISLGSFFKVKNGQMMTSDKVNDFFSFFEDRYAYEKPQLIKMDIDEFKKYVNPEKKTPIILMMPLNKNQPENFSFNPAWVLIGIKNTEKKLVLHNYWQGNNYEISFDDFNKIKEVAQKTGGSACILIQPKDLEGKLKELENRTTLPYSPRTSVMIKGSEMFDNYALGKAFFFSNRLRLQESFDYLLKIKNDPNFEEFFPPILKVRTYNTLAVILNSQQKTDEALQYANLAVAINHGLDKSFKGYPGYDGVVNAPGKTDQFGETYTILGDIYSNRKDFEKATENYRKSLEIWPNYNKSASNGLRMSTMASTVNQSSSEEQQ